MDKNDKKLLAGFICVIALYVIFCSAAVKAGMTDLYAAPDGIAPFATLAGFVPGVGVLL